MQTLPTEFSPRVPLSSQGPTGPAPDCTSLQMLYLLAVGCSTQYILPGFHQEPHCLPITASVQEAETAFKLGTPALIPTKQNPPPTDIFQS